MDQFEYLNKYPKFGGHIADFCDPAGDDTQSDIQIAKRVRLDLPTGQRVLMLTELLDEVEHMLSNMQTEWKGFSRAVNRLFAGPEDARSWLEDIRRAWMEELARIKDARS